MRHPYVFYMYIIYGPSKIIPLRLSSDQSSRRMMMYPEASPISCATSDAQRKRQVFSNTGWVLADTQTTQWTPGKHTSLRCIQTYSLSQAERVPGSIVVFSRTSHCRVVVRACMCFEVNETVIHPAIMSCYQNTPSGFGFFLSKVYCIPRFTFGTPEQRHG